MLFKEVRAGGGLKNRLREFLLIFAYVIFMVFRVYLCGIKTYLTVIVVTRGRSQKNCPK